MYNKVNKHEKEIKRKYEPKAPQIDRLGVFQFLTGCEIFSRFPHRHFHLFIYSCLDSNFHWIFTSFLKKTLLAFYPLVLSLVKGCLKPLWCLLPEVFLIYFRAELYYIWYVHYMNSCNLHPSPQSCFFQVSLKCKHAYFIAQRQSVSEAWSCSTVQQSKQLLPELCDGVMTSVQMVT